MLKTRAGDIVGNTPALILEDYVDRAELARQLGRTERTVARWEQERIGPPVTRLGRRVLYFIPSVQEWLRSREAKMVRERARHATPR